MEIVASVRGERVRVGLLDGDVLREFWLWDLARPDGVGDVYTGRVEAVAAGLAGRFVDLGDGSGFLPDSAGGKKLTVGEYVCVEVTRGAQGGKGPRLAVREGVAEARVGLKQRGKGPLLELCERVGVPVRVDDYGLMAQLRPALEGRMHYDASAFDAVLEDEVAGLGERVASLPMGAKMRISPTEAAVLVDVDAGAGSDVQPLALNLAVIPELCRQIVLRNLSGGILVDFAGMKAAVREKLAPALRAALAQDFLRPELLGFSKLGFAEIVRRRVRPPLHEVWG